MANAKRKARPASVSSRTELPAETYRRVEELWDVAASAWPHQPRRALSALTRILELVPTSTQAYRSRAMVQTAMKQPAAAKSDLRNAEALEKLAAKNGWPPDPVETIRAAAIARLPVATIEHTISSTANYYCAEIDAEVLKQAGFLTRATEGELRIVVGAHTTKSGYEAVAFPESKSGKSWKPVGIRLTGARAQGAIARLVALSRRHEELARTLTEVLDGFDEQKQYKDSEG